MDAHPKRWRERSRALTASTSRLRAGAEVCKEVKSRRAVSETSSTARLKASAFACDGALKPESLRTNCSAEARTSSSLAGGSKLNKVRILRHITGLLRPRVALQQDGGYRMAGRQLRRSCLEFRRSDPAQPASAI